jgi:hypothetical protein
MTAVEERDWILGGLAGAGYVMTSPPVPYAALRALEPYLWPQRFEAFMIWNNIPVIGALVLLFAATLRLITAGAEQRHPADAPCRATPPAQPIET